MPARRPANCSPCRHSRISRIGDVQSEASTAPSPDGVPFVIAEHQRIASFHHFACEKHHQEKNLERKDLTCIVHGSSSRNARNGTAGASAVLNTGPPVSLGTT